MSSVDKKNNYKFGDLVDVPAFSRVLEHFFLATGIPNGIVDANGELLFMFSGDNACNVFHRSNPLAEKCCQQSNIDIMRDLQDGHIAGGLCQNGLMDYATPVVIEGRQIATLFLGQILHSPPDMEFFRQQAKQFGFDEASYLKSISEIPVIDKKLVNEQMAVMVEMAQMLAGCGLARIKQTKLESDISTSTEKRIQIEDIVNFSPIAIGWSDIDNNLEYINQKFTELFGYKLDDFTDLESWYKRAYPDETYRKEIITPWRNNVKLAHENKVTPPTLETDIHCKNGDIKRVVVHISWVGSRRLASFVDISERWADEQRTQAHDKMLEMVAKGTELSLILNAIVLQVEAEDKNVRCSVLLLDNEKKHLLIGAAPSLPDFYNHAINGIEIGIGVGSCGTSAFIHERVIVEDMWTHEYWQPYLELVQRAGLKACWSDPIMSSQGQVLGTFAIYHNQICSPQKKDMDRINFATNLAAIAIENSYVQKELERRAYSDYLTGLANRRYFLERAEVELNRTLRYGGDLSILMFDIDHFKRVNDTYGHKIGDLVLEKIAKTASHIIRNIDIIGRIGGEEFAILLPETEEKQAFDTAERLRTAIEAKAISLEGGLPLHFTASFGVTTLKDKNTNIDMLLNQADQALYQSKNAGRNKVSTYQAQLF